MCFNNELFYEYILEVCQEKKSPVFLGVSEGASKYMGGFNVVVGMVNGLKKDAGISRGAIVQTGHRTGDINDSTAFSKLQKIKDVEVCRDILLY